MSDYFAVTYKEVTMIPTLLQVGYLTGLVFITPLADLIPRRPLVLGLVFLASSFCLGLALCDSFLVFQVLSYAVGVCSVSYLCELPLCVLPKYCIYSRTCLRLSPAGYTPNSQCFDGWLSACSQASNSCFDRCYRPCSRDDVCPVRRRPLVSPFILICPTSLLTHHVVFLHFTT